MAASGLHFESTTQAILWLASSAFAEQNRRKWDSPAGRFARKRASLLIPHVSHTMAYFPPHFNRTRQVPIRTISFIPCQIKLPLNQSTPIYQKLAPKIKELKALGMSNAAIAYRLNINIKTVIKGNALCTRQKMI
ncbi:MAG TPA: hypothetical protein VMR37_07550 [Rhabdochlamydiaceae bacterium]|nr:hypothetical protein [Rhabdochlamydiaceae bacterium]